MNTPKSPVRKRNAADSRQALLVAAQELFAERGYERSTIREIGDRAGLDPTLIARYFGNKAALYLAALRSDFEAEDGAVPDLLEPERMLELLDRVQRKGPSPVLDTALRQHPEPALDAEAREVLTERIVDPLVRRIDAEPIGPRSTADARLQAEIIAAAFIGVAVGRHVGAFPALAAASNEQVSELLALALGALAPSSAD
jgi:AcrR family transcriptional regulator